LKFRVLIFQSSIDLGPEDHGVTALFRCWLREKDNNCFLDLSFTKMARGHVLPLGEPHFWVYLTEVDPEKDQLTMAFQEVEMPAGELPAIGEDVYLIANFKGLVWELYPY
jgi:hypothetical protein